MVSFLQQLWICYTLYFLSFRHEPFLEKRRITRVAVFIAEKGIAFERSVQLLQRWQLLHLANATFLHVGAIISAIGICNSSVNGTYYCWFSWQSTNPDLELFCKFNKLFEPPLTSNFAGVICKILGKMLPYEKYWQAMFVASRKTIKMSIFDFRNFIGSVS